MDAIPEYNANTASLVSCPQRQALPVEASRPFQSSPCREKRLAAEKYTTFSKSGLPE